MSGHRVLMSLDEAGSRLVVRFGLRWSAARSTPERPGQSSKTPWDAWRGPPKRSIDVFLEGRCYPSNASRTQGEARLSLAGVDRRVRVLGRRFAVTTGGVTTFSAPEPFAAVALTMSNAYGGTSAELSYPRNPVGKGFCLADDGRQTVELPNVEEVTDLLEPADMRRPYEAWPQLPVPALFVPILPVVFPRCAMFGFADFGAVLDSSVAEVRNGDIAAPGESPRADAGLERWQEAPRRSRIERLEPGAPIFVSGCLPGGREWHARAPRTPRVSLLVDGRRDLPDVRAQAIRLRPEADEISVSYAFEHPLPRAFIEGIHARIPISVEVEGERFDYPAPPPVLSQVRSNKTEPLGGEP